MKILQAKQKREGDFLITAFFNKKTDRPNCIYVERKVPFTFDNKQVEETAILRFKDNHKKGQVYTIETFFANMLFDKISAVSGFYTFHTLRGKDYKRRYNLTLKQVWENPLKNKHLFDFIDFFNNFESYLKMENIFSLKQFSLHHFAREMYLAYKDVYESKHPTTNTFSKTNEVIKDEIISR